MDSTRDITNLVHLYAERVDEGDFAGVAELFARGQVSAEGDPRAHRGREAVERFYAATARLHADGTPRTQHVVSNLIITSDEAAGTAECRSRFTVFQATDTLPLQVIVVGRYEDTFARDADGWHFTSRHIRCDLFGDLSQHLLIDPSSLPGHS
ncbi:MAG: nuclear transport factor 2 family protein [Proteobacteria bacterium]|nr:nuclear transport factor 2 family protein [Pseudomonadota bacterium]